MADEKRRRLDTWAQERRIADCRSLLARLESVYGNLPEDVLWDVDKFQKLILPRTGATGENSSNEFTYVGRARGRALYERVRNLIRGNTLLILGAKGSGKSTVMASIAAFLLVHQKKRVVYLSAADFCRNPVKTLRDALLVATGADEEVGELATMEELDLWCEAQRGGSDENLLLFVVDDWDKFEGHEAEELQLEGIACLYHILVKLSSSNSRDRHLTDSSDKPPLSIDFDGPYSEEELLTWIAQSSLSTDKLKDLDCLTGGMPRLLRLYEEVGGDAVRYRQLIEEKYTKKLYEKLVEPQSSPAQLGALVQLITSGEREAVLARPFHFTCFYKDPEGKLRLLSPFLRSRLEFYIMDRSASLEMALLLRDIQRWTAAVRLDCVIKGRNPARVGWNVEGLTISVMRYQGKLWDDLHFKHVKTYEHGCEALVLVNLTEEELLEGVLVIPVAFNEQVLDVVYLRLKGKTLEVKPVQITVSLWKHKKRKRSHLVWQEEVLPRWLAEEYAVKHQFVYVMPKTLTQSELGQVESDLLKYVEQSREAATTSSDSEEIMAGQSEVYDEEFTNLNKVESEELLFKTFGDVHTCLKEFDRRLRLGQAPDPPEKKALKQCSGLVVQGEDSRRCKRWCRTDDPTWSCCPAHQPTASSPRACSTRFHVKVWIRSPVPR